MKDVRQVAVAVLANKRRRAISGGTVVMVTVSTLLLSTASYLRSLIKQVAFINRVKSMMNKNDELSADVSWQENTVVHITNAYYGA